MRRLCLVALAFLLPPAVLRAADAGDKYPFDPQLRVLAEDVKNPCYRKLVTQKMLATDLAALPGALVRHARTKRAP